MSWLWALGIAAVCAGLETWLSGPKPFAVLASFKQPSWALPIWGWMAVGAVFYLVMTFALFRAFEAGPSGTPAIVLIVVVMVTDGFWNYLLFKRRRLNWSYLYLFPYALCVGAALWATAVIDPLAALGIGLYFVFLPYDFVWARALARLNPPLAGSP
jgi:tryptophan-rich sensory protein